MTTNARVLFAYRNGVAVANVFSYQRRNSQSYWITPQTLTPSTEEGFVL